MYDIIELISFSCIQKLYLVPEAKTQNKNGRKVLKCFSRNILVPEANIRTKMEERLL
jgi:hypothetical protein